MTSNPAKVELLLRKFDENYEGVLVKPIKVSDDEQIPQVDIVHVCSEVVREFSGVDNPVLVEFELSNNPIDGGSEITFMGCKTTELMVWKTGHVKWMSRAKRECALHCLDGWSDVYWSLSMVIDHLMPTSLDLGELGYLYAKFTDVSDPQL